MKIWVYLNGMQQGPYTPDEFSTLPVDATTPVWYEGLPQWMPAGEAPATAAMFASRARQTVNYKHTPQADVHVRDSIQTELPPQPPTFIGWSVFVLLCCFPIGGLLGIVFSSMSGNAYRSGDYDRAKRLSEYAEWCVILSIVIGLMSMPLALILF